MRLKAVLSAIVLMLTFGFTYGQTESQKLPIQGTFEVVEGSYLERLVITDNKVQGMVGEEVVEQYYLFDTSQDQFILELVKPHTDFVEPSIQKDRKLLVAQLNELENGNYQLDINLPNGESQQIQIKK